MHYFEEDLNAFVGQSPYLALSRIQSAEFLVQEAVKEGLTMEAELREYPIAWYEPLEFYYACLNGLGAMNPRLLADLVQDWRGIVWGCFLVSINPRPEYSEAIFSIDASLPNNQWIIDLARAELNEVAPPEETVSIRDGIRKIRRLLEPLERPVTTPRLAPTPEQLNRLKTERQEIANIYKTSGADSAKAAIVGTLSGFFATSYRDWLAGGCLTPPEE